MTTIEDERLNPATQARNLLGRENETGKNSAINAGIDQAEAYANDPNNKSKNIEDAEQRENDVAQNQFGYQAPEKQAKRKLTFKSVLKKGGPIGGIGALLFGGIFGAGILLSPSLAVVHLKEVLTDDLNDQVTAMDIRSTHVLRAKTKDLGKKAGTCTLIKVRCGLRGFSDKQIKNFEKAGITVQTAGEKNSFGKTPIKSLIFRDSAGKFVKVNNISDLSKHLRDSNIRSQVRHAYNPKFMGFTDKVAVNVFEKLRTSKAPKLNGHTTKEFDKSVDSSIKGEQTDARAKPLTEEEKKKNAQVGAEANKIVDGVKGSAGKTVKSVFSGAAKGLLITGAADSACSVYNGSRAVGALAKTKRAVQLAGFAMIFLNFADSVKAGDATPEQSEYVGNKLMAIDTDQKIINEESKKSKDDKPEMVSNPDYGKNALDAQAVQTAFYNDAPTLSARSQAFMVGGGLVGTLASVNTKIAKVLGTSPSGISSKCKTVTNGWVRAGSLVVGVIAGIGSFGAWTAVSVGASIAISVAMPLIQSYLGNIIAGTTVTSKTKGVDAGNAIFSGTAVINGDMAKQRGMKPLSRNEIRNYQAHATEVKNEYIAMETEDAKSDPLNVMKQYSFMGQLARNLLPLTGSSSSSILGSLLSIMPKAASSILPRAYAGTDFNPDRFSKCTDTAYQAIGIDADIMCNVRYGLSDKELAMDTDDVMSVMFKHGYIDEDRQAIDGSAYTDWVAACVERTDGWGETSEDGKNDGKECMNNKKWKDISYFRVFTVDQSIDEGMDDGPTVGTVSSSSSSTSGESNAVAGDVTWPLDKKVWLSNKSDFLNAHIPSTGTAWGGDNMGTSGKGAGIASDIGVPVGTPVYAMVGGKVTSTNLCGSNDGIAIKSDIDGKTLGIAYMHGSHQKFKVGDTVSAGDRIMDSGAIGCHVFGPHLHIGMAYDGHYICPQDVFLALGDNQAPDFAALIGKGKPTCGR